MFAARSTTTSKLSETGNFIYFTDVLHRRLFPNIFYSFFTCTHVSLSLSMSVCLFQRTSVGEQWHMFTIYLCVASFHIMPLPIYVFSEEWAFISSHCRHCRPTAWIIKSWEPSPIVVVVASLLKWPLYGVACGNDAHNKPHKRIHGHIHNSVYARVSTRNYEWMNDAASCIVYIKNA